MLSCLTLQIYWIENWFVIRSPVGYHHFIAGRYEVESGGCQQIEQIQNTWKTGAEIETGEPGVYWKGKVIKYGKAAMKGHIVAVLVTLNFPLMF